MRLPTITFHQDGFGDGKYKDGWTFEMINWDHITLYTRRGEHMTESKPARISKRRGRRGNAMITVYKALGTEYFKDKMGYTVWPYDRNQIVWKIKEMLNLQDSDQVDSSEILPLWMVN